MVAVRSVKVRRLRTQRHYPHKHVVTASLDARRVERGADTMQSWQPPRLTDVQAIDRVAMTADRFMRQFLRLMKAYRDQRRLFATLVVGQMNIAGEGGQQVIATRAVRATPARRPRPMRRPVRRKRAAA
jgi:hypothetical protein